MAFCSCFVSSSSDSAHLGVNASTSSGASNTASALPAGLAGSSVALHRSIGRGAPNRADSSSARRGGCGLPDLAAEDQLGGRPGRSFVEQRADLPRSELPGTTVAKGVLGHGLSEPRYSSEPPAQGSRFRRSSRFQDQLR